MQEAELHTGLVEGRQEKTEEEGLANHPRNPASEEDFSKTRRDASARYKMWTGRNREIEKYLENAAREKLLGFVNTLLAKRAVFPWCFFGVQLNFSRLFFF